MYKPLYWGDAFSVETDFHQQMKSLFSERTLKYMALSGIGIIIFGNHYARDVVGALEKQMESDIPMTSQQYANLNSLFFIPNTISPFIAGAIVELLGGPTKTLIYSCFFAGTGSYFG